MFPALLRLISRPPAPSDADLHFVLEVHEPRARKQRRDPRTTRFILNCWILIALKHVAIIYACHRWPMPFHQLWVNAPTFALGLLATTVYYWRSSRR